MPGKSIGTRRLRPATVLVALLLAACGSVDPEAELAAARASFAAGDYRTAAVHLGNVLQADPAHAEARAIRGGIALAVGDYASAVAEYRAALDRGIAPAVVALGYAEALIEAGQSPAARQVLAEAEAALADSFDYWTLVAEAELAGGDTSASAGALDRADRLGGPSARSLILRARLAAAANDPGAAEALLVQAAAEFPGEPRVPATRGQLYLQTGRLDEAGEQLRLAVAAYRARGAALPQVPVLLQLVQLALATNDPEAAAATADELRDLAPDSGVSLYAEALVEYQAGRFDAAVGLVERAVSAQPDVPQFVTLLGAVHLALGNLGQAEQYLQRATGLAPRDPAPAKLLAETRLRQQRPDAALDALRSVTGLGETDAQIAYLTGIASLQRGDTAAGLAALEQAGVIESAELQGALVELYDLVRADNAAAAEAAADALVQDFPDEPQALTAAALFRMSRNDAARADGLLARAVEINGGYVPARLLRAELFAQGGRAEDAAAELDAAAAAAPDHPDVKLAQGRLALARGDAEAALAVAGELTDAFPDRSDAWALEGEAEIALRRYDAAASAFAAAFDRSPEWLIRSRWINALQLAGRQGEVLEQYLAAVTDDGNNVVALNNASWMLLEAGRAGEALPLAERANTLVPGNPAILDTLGWTLVTLNREQDAIAHLEQAVASAPDAAEIRYHLAVAQARTGRAEEARAQLEALLANDAAFEQRPAAESLLESL